MVDWLSYVHPDHATAAIGDHHADDDHHHHADDHHTDDHHAVRGQRVGDVRAEWQVYFDTVALSGHADHRAHGSDPVR
jgi:hypothetical protein